MSARADIGLVEARWEQGARMHSGALMSARADILLVEAGREQGARTPSGALA